MRLMSICSQMLLILYSYGLGTEMWYFCGWRMGSCIAIGARRGGFGVVWETDRRISFSLNDIE